MKKHVRYFLAGLLLPGFFAGLAAADTNVLQRLNFAIIGTYEETRTNAVITSSPTNLVIFTNTANHQVTNRLVQAYSTETNHLIKTVLINAQNVVRAIAIDLDKFRPVVDKTNYLGTTNYLVNGILYHKVDINTGEESIVVRKGTNELDVTSFFGGPAAITNNFNTQNEVDTVAITSTGIKTNLAVSMNSISFTSSNLQFSITNAYAKSFLTTVGNSRVKNLLATGAGTFYVNISSPLSTTNHYTNDTLATTNITFNPTNSLAVTNLLYTYSNNFLFANGTTNYYGIVTNINPVDYATNVPGPAHGTFSTTVGSILK